ncbi:MAG TPA: glycosyltransferase family 1 protein [Acidobacteriota bacterium]|nr:glycosyltransferase family 1 protein [Acidobacteriota bacterium]
MAFIGIDIRKLGDFGIGTYIRNLLLELDKLGGDHKYLLFKKPDEKTDSLPPGMETRDEASRLYSLSEPFKLGLSARREGLELLHCPHYVTAFAPGCPMAVTIHDLIHLLFPQYLPNRSALRYARYFLRRAARKAAVIFAVSERTKADILKHLPAKEERIVVTHNAVDPRMLREPGEAELAEARFRYGLDHPCVLYVGNLKPHKNLGIAVEAFARFRKKAGDEWRFVVAGSEAVDNEVHKRIEMSGAKGAVRFLGFIPGRHLPSIFRLADIFLFPSLYEGFGLPPLEAMAAGVPVVSSNTSSMPEVLGDAALLVDPQDPVAMGDALLRILDDAELRRRLIAGGRERAAGYSWRKSAEKTLSGYLRALGRAGSDL